MTNPSAILDRVISLGVVPVIRTSTAALALTSVEWLREAGFRTFEITLTIPTPLRSLKNSRANRIY